MKRLQLRLAKWLLKRLDYKFVAIRAKNGTTDVISDGALLSYTDVVGFLTKKEPAILKRVYSREVASAFGWRTPISKLPPEVVAEIALMTQPFSEEIKKQNETID